MTLVHTDETRPAGTLLTTATADTECGVEIRKLLPKVVEVGPAERRARVGELQAELDVVRTEHDIEEVWGQIAFWAGARTAAVKDTEESK